LDDGAWVVGEIRKWWTALPAAMTMERQDPATRIPGTPPDAIGILDGLGSPDRTQGKLQGCRSELNRMD